MALSSPHAPSIAPTIRSASTVNRELTRQLHLPSESPSPRRVLNGGVAAPADPQQAFLRIRQLLAVAMTIAATSGVGFYMTSVVQHHLSQEREGEKEAQLKVTEEGKVSAGKPVLAPAQEKRKRVLEDAVRGRESKRKRVEREDESVFDGFSSSPSSSDSAHSSKACATSIQRDQRAILLDAAVIECGNAFQSMLGELTVALATLWDSTDDDVTFAQRCLFEENGEEDEDAQSTASDPFLNSRANPSEITYGERQVTVSLYATLKNSSGLGPSLTAALLKQSLRTHTRMLNRRREAMFSMAEGLSVASIGVFAADGEDEERESSETEVLMEALAKAQARVDEMWVADTVHETRKEREEKRVRAVKAVFRANDAVMKALGTDVSVGWDDKLLDHVEQSVLGKMKLAIRANRRVVGAALWNLDERESSFEAEDGDGGGELNPERLGDFDERDRVAKWLQVVDLLEEGRESKGRPSRRRIKAQKAALEKAKVATKTARLKKKKEAKEKEAARRKRVAARFPRD